MITLYTHIRNTSCRKALQWLATHQLNVTIRNTMRVRLTKNELRHILSLTENGTDDILRQGERTKGLNFESMTVEKLLDTLIEQPHLLKNPLMVKGNTLLCGYSEEELRAFLPRKYREITNLVLRKKGYEDLMNER